MMHFKTKTLSFKILMEINKTNYNDNFVAKIFSKFGQFF